MILNIYSYDNAMIKHVRQLTKRRYRQKYEQYIVEGIRIIRDALENNIELECVLFCEDLYNTSGGEVLIKDLIKNNYKIYQIPSKMFMELSDTQNPQGVMAVVPIQVYDLDYVLKKKDSLFLVLDRIQDPGNLGTIIRTADAAGFDGVLISKGCVDLYNLKAIRSTMGSIFHLPIIHGGETMEIIHRLKLENIKIVSTSLETNQYYDQIDYKGKTAVVIGNEANGVLKEVIDDSDHIVKIPIAGNAESLNASIAAAVIMYEALRQRRNQKI